MENENNRAFVLEVRTRAPGVAYYVRPRTDGLPGVKSTRNRNEAPRFSITEAREIIARFPYLAMVPK